ncbi:hypothetical protein OLX02_19880 [Novosphingobium sp. KCTC 2891]|uniref:PGN_0703 family putative restriction endonuclease n=1 Tax=Novosphingobium sp. KCTC 2891 TaxID=2989730 RepID=UPI0022236464|nr:hypothetical protein [Novosphingobium sp. KCTC 2891]MCW1385080.1 hypothetical protein [Novosphingobium sp. KCTC 2891]
MSKRCTFAGHEHRAQIDYFDKHFAEHGRHRDRPFQLAFPGRLHNLLPAVRGAAERLFHRDALDIQFHTYIGHGRSSQACCINFLMPFADKPDLLSRWVGSVLGIDPPRMLPLEKEIAGAHRFVAFEYTGPDDRDFLGEAEGRVPGRGANATAADAAVAFEDTDGARHLLLIEWKYTEEYRSHRLSQDRNGKRQARYADKLFAPDGPVRADLGLSLADFLHEPFYQLVRQQMLAFQIERQSERFDRARVLHLSPAGNHALHQVTSPAFATLGGMPHDDAFVAFASSLVDPAAFIGRTVEEAFAPLAGWAEADWWPALAARYSSLCGGETDK